MSKKCKRLQKIFEFFKILHNLTKNLKVIIIGIYYNERGQIVMIDDIRAAQLSKEYYATVRSHCIYLVGDEFEADDIVQNVFLLFEHKRKTLEDENVKAWLYKVTRVLVKEFFRKQKREAERLLPYTEYDGMINDIMESIARESEYSEEEIEEKKAIIMNSLTETERAIIVMHKEDKTYKQIAEELGLTEKNVNVTAYRTRKKIEEKAKTLSSQWVMLLIKIYF